MKQRKEGNTQTTAAAKAGFCERSARNVEKRGYQVPQTKQHPSTRKDAFIGIWEKELVLCVNKNIASKLKLFSSISNKHLRTLQSRVRKWRSLYGPDKEVIFRPPPG